VTWPHARAVCAQRDHCTTLRHILHGNPDITERGNETSPPSKSARGGGLDQLARGAVGGLSVAIRPQLSSALGLDQAPAARHSERTPGQPPSTSGAIAFWLAPPQDQAAGLVRAEPRLDYASVRGMLELLRDGSEAPAAANQRNIVRAMCRVMLAEVVGGHPVACVQADAASSLAVPASRIAQVTTWSLAEDSEMVDKPEEVRETTLDPQVQMWYGSERGRLVLTGMASVVLQWMVGSQNLDSAAGRFHALDLVPVSALHTNEKNANGTYKESPNMAALEARCAPKTLGFFVGNPAYAIVILQGAMGARNLNKLCAQRKIELTVASSAVYNLFGMMHRVSELAKSARAVDGATNRALLLLQATRRGGAGSGGQAVDETNAAARALATAFCSRIEWVKRPETRARNAGRGGWHPTGSDWQTFGLRQ
jgi:hypothetical protein